MRIVVLIVFMVTGVIAAGCDFDRVTGSFDRPIAVVDGFTFELALSDTRFQTGDTLNGSFFVYNGTPWSATFRFSTTCQLGFRIESDIRTLVTRPQQCGDGLTTLTVPPRSLQEIAFQAALVNDAGETLPAGSYRVAAYLLEGNSPPLTKSFTILRERRRP